MNTTWVLRCLNFYNSIRDYNNNESELLEFGRIQELLSAGQDLFYEMKDYADSWKTYEPYFRYYIFLDGLLKAPLGIQPLEIDTKTIKPGALTTLISSVNMWLEKYHADPYKRMTEASELVESLSKNNHSPEWMLTQMVAKYLKGRARTNYVETDNKKATLVIRPMLSLDPHQFEEIRDEQRQQHIIRLPIKIQNFGPGDVTNLKIFASIPSKGSRSLKVEPSHFMSLANQQSRIVHIHFSHDEVAIFEIEVGVTYHTYAEIHQPEQRAKPRKISLAGWRRSSDTKLQMLYEDVRVGNILDSLYNESNNAAGEIPYQLHKDIIAIRGARLIGKSYLIQRLSATIFENQPYKVEVVDGSDVQITNVREFLNTLLAARIPPEHEDLPRGYVFDQWLDELKGDTVLLLILDHVQLLRQRMGTEVFRGLLEIIQQPIYAKRVKLIMVEDYTYTPISALPEFKETFRDLEESNIRMIELNLLNEQQSIEVARKLLSVADLSKKEPITINFDDLAGSYLYQITGGHLYLIQLVCKALVDVMSDTSQTFTKSTNSHSSFFDSTINVVDFKKAVAALMTNPQIVQHIDELARSYGEEEYNFLQCLAEQEAIDLQTGDILCWAVPTREQFYRFDTAWRRRSFANSTPPLSLDVLKERLLIKEIIGYSTPEETMTSKTSLGTPRLRIGLFYLCLLYQQPSYTQFNDTVAR